MSRSTAVVAMSTLTVLFTVLAVREAAIDSPTFDEPKNLSAGVTYLTRHDIRLNVEHPPLAKAVEALPVLLLHPKIPQGPSWDMPLADFDEQFYLQNAGEIRRITLVSRLPDILMAVAIGWLLYAIGARLGGRRVGLIAGGLWLSTPLVLAHGHLAGLDIPFTLAVVASALLTLNYSELPTWPRAVAVGAVGGTALLVRTTGLVIVPLLCVAVVFASGWRPRRLDLARAVAVFAVAWAVLWIGYRTLSPSPSSIVRDQYAHLENCGPPDCTRQTIVDRALKVLPTPIEFRTGTRVQGIFAAVPHDGFMFGRHLVGNVWWFWPLGLLLKLPFPVLVALAAAPAGWLQVRERRRAAALAFALPANANAAATVLQAAPAGIRYLLPVIALALPAGALVADRIIDALPRWPVVLLGMLVVAQAGSYVEGATGSIAWTAWPFRPGYRWVADSNLDWAQDLHGLRSFARDHQPWIAFDSPLVRLQPIDGARNLRGADLSTVDGWIAVGGSPLDVYSRDELSWLRAYCAVGEIGDSIVLYHFDRPPDVRPGPVQPVAPCTGREFSERRG